MLIGKRGWKTSLAYILAALFGLCGSFLGHKAHPYLGYAAGAALAALCIVLHKKAGTFLEDLQVFSLKQKRLEAKAWYFESVITNSGNIIFTTDVEHRILKFNRGSERAFGISQTDVLGKEVHALFASPVEISALLARVDE